MNNKLFYQSRFFLFSFFAFFISSTAVSAQSIKPDPQIIREMIAYSAQAEKATNTSRDQNTPRREAPKAIEKNQEFPLLSPGEGKNSSLYAFERKAFAIINEQRASRGLKPLNWNEDMARVARLHSQNMARYKFFSHTGIDGSKVADRAKALAERNWYSISENIAFNKGFKLPVESACQQWMSSPGHRQNLLDEEWTESGIGAAVAPDGSFYLTQVFIN